MGSQSAEQKKGILYAAGAYTMWGILPIYWKWVEEVPADEILAHRIVWAFVFMLLVLGVTKRFRQFIGEFVNLFKRPKLLMSLTIASVLISGNWFVYIWAVNHNHVIEASLGYYINPLISILLGTVVLKEKLNFWQYVAVGLAGVGVIILTVRFGSFGSISMLSTLLLIGAGIVTALPLFYFAKGAQLIPLYMVGFLQYIAPTISLILGVFVFGEHFTSTHMIAFFCIWVALFVFSVAKTKFLVQKQPKFIKNKSAKVS
ncbi:EamA family transporter RarD [Bacillus cereus]|uniref:EamA family transporter RarD n=1 Tax=Bacillus cereus TaxID=1396 RepID=UPI000BF5092C|nr:EamA family transporter RarD [Bacillus cereus]PFQ33101.1 protein RarD [Bacillus cereus]PGX44871.1 protein RarD [Bacillus cereus]